MDISLAYSKHGLSLCVGVKFQWFGGEDDERFWSTGVWEYWSIGKAKAPISTWTILFITPLLHHSITPADFQMKGSSPLGAVQNQVFWAWILYKEQMQPR